MMQKMMSWLTQNSWARALVMILVGIWFIAAPYSVYHIVKWVIAIALLAMALPSLFRGIKAGHSTTGYNAELVRGITLLVAALLVLALLRPVLGFTPLMFGLLLVIYGINRMASARRAKQYVNVSIVPTVIYGALITIVGVVLMFNPFRTVLLMLQVTGGLLIVMAIMETIDRFRQRRAQ